VPFVKVGQEDGAEIAIHFRDHRAGRPIVLVDGYPLDGDSWGAVAST
jgi:non-heme chloroperoxidase